MLISRRKVSVPFPHTNKRQTQSFSFDSDTIESLPISPLINDISIEAPLPEETAQIGKFHRILASEIQRTALEKRLMTIVCPPGARSNQDMMLIKRVTPLCVSFPLCAIGAKQCKSVITIFTNYQTTVFQDLVCSHTVKLNRHQHANRRYFVQLYLLSCGLTVTESETLISRKVISSKSASSNLEQFMCGADNGVSFAGQLGLSLIHI